ncbi:PAS domain-containing protein [Caballeronia sp. GAFFF2]|uniref:PAS domain-containing hybrid sensor histidine kinase/response regulator n=1 Tax=Caballeronia sp. GAFFF2 TaxID=2921741 RepID=UPI0020281D7C|nr:PAS domain-containing protein [Caballeronia sp. GAFFF2]
MAASLDELVVSLARCRSNEALLERALASSRIGAWLWDLEHNTATLTPVAAEIYGYSEDTGEVPLNELWDRVAPEKRNQFAEAVSDALRRDAPFELTFPFVIANGERRLFQLKGESEVDATQSRITRVFGVTYDVTELYRLQAQLLASERRHRALTELSSELAWATDASGHQILMGAEEWARFTGFATRQRIDAGWFDAVHPDDRERVRRQWRGVVKDRLCSKLAFRLMQREQGYRSMTARIVPIFDDTDELVEWFCVTVDRTQEEEGIAAIKDRDLRLFVAMRGARTTTGHVDLSNWCVHWDDDQTSLNDADGTTGLPYSSVLTRVHPEDRGLVDAALQTAARGEMFDHPIEFRTVADGGAQWVQGCIVLQRDSEGHPHRLVGSVVDINERKQLELTLRDSDRRKDEFLAMLAHELRNPLAPMRTAITLLERPEQSEQRASDLVGMIHRQIDSMARLVDDLLDVSRITHGQIKLQRTPMLVGSAVYAALETVASMTTSRRQNVSVQLPLTPVWVCGDATRLSQVLVNVLNNASKYTQEEGSIRIAVAALSDTATITISDNGSGISPTLLPHIFDLFSQGERTLDRSEGGLGIGLSLVKRLVQLHDGAISLTSPGPGLGTTVTINLPLIHPDNAQPVEDSFMPDLGALGSGAARVLIVDDNHDAADSLGMLCEVEGHTATVVYESRAAIDAVETQHFDVALLDIGLPEIDGYELARRIRDKGSAKPVLIAVTGYGQAEDHLRTQAAGFDHHLVKPIDVQRLLDLLDRERNSALNGNAH